MAPLGLPWSYSSSSSDPAQGTREEARRSMRHANSPRRPRRLFSSRRFRHTAVSPPSCTRAMHSCRTGPVPWPAPASGDRRGIAMRAILSHSRIARGWRLSHHRVKDTAYLAAERISGDLTAGSRTLGGNRQPQSRTLLRSSGASDPPGPPPRPTRRAAAARCRRRCPRPTGA